VVTDWWTARTVAITGATGYVGTALRNRLAARGARLRLATRQARPTEHDSVCWQQGDIRDPDLWRAIVAGADVIFHLAAQTSVPVAERDEEGDFAANVRPAMLLGQACRRFGNRPLVVYAGTVTQAGRPSAEASVLSEDGPDAPSTVYDLHKLMAETYLRQAARVERFRMVSLRLSTVYGPGPPSPVAERGVLNAMARRALSGVPLTIYAPGTQLRDYIFIDDVTEALMLAAECADTTEGQVFAIGSGERRTVAEAFSLLADEAARKTGTPVPVHYVAAPTHLHPINFRSYVVDATRFQQATGWRPRTNLDRGVAMTLDWLAGLS